MSNPFPIPVGILLANQHVLPTPDPADAGVQTLQNDGSNQPRWVAAGSTSGIQVLTSDPFPPVDDTAWILRSGTSPTQTVALRVRIGGVTSTLIAITQ